MTKIIGLTGGIGSGKTTVANEFLTLGIPVYFADIESKKLMQQPHVIEQIIAAFGAEIIDQHTINTVKLAAIVFADSAKLKQLNAIIHPEVHVHFNQWLTKHSQYPLVVKEAAILFESGSAANCDYIISVQAPEDERIQRVMLRDQVGKAQVVARIKHQWTDEMRAAKSDFTITNLSQESLKNQVQSILNTIQLTSLE
ncbi:MAG: dephospho-CoA kinase [Flavobacterium sp.]|nr:dephospho-CoA kinase [Flavobacterium sp.]